MPVPLNRRCVLRASAAAATAPLFIPSRAFGASERPVLGIIGAGTRASQLVPSLMKLARIAAVADVSLPRAERMAKDVGADDCGQDYRSLLDRQDIDAVVVATPLHWHALCCIHAAQAGKDIYCEKPLAYTITDGRKVAEAVRKYGRVFQTGLQQRSGRAECDGCRLVRDGVLGPVTRVVAYNYPSPMEPQFPGQPVPAGLDWDRWCGPVEPVPFNAAIWDNRSNPAWVSLRPFSGGAMTDWGAHGLDMAQWGLGMDGGGPEEVWVEGKPFEPQSSTPEQPGGRQKGPVAPKVLMRYGNGIILEFMGGPQFGVTFVGPQGSMTVQRNRFTTTPATILPSDTGIIHEDGANSTFAHCQNWVDCIRSRGEPAAGVEVGQRSTSIGHLANIARWTSGLTGRVGEKLRWDAATERFTNSPEANTFLARYPRRGYELPAT
jgi:predicted dehydrogenase